MAEGRCGGIVESVQDREPDGILVDDGSTEIHVAERVVETAQELTDGYRCNDDLAWMTDEARDAYANVPDAPY